MRQYHKEKGKGNGESPSSLRRLSQLAIFRYSMQKVKYLKYDMEVIANLLDSNNAIIADRFREANELHVTRLQWLIQSLQSEVFMLQYERDKLSFCVSFGQQSLEEFLIRIGQLLIQSLLVKEGERRETFEISSEMLKILKRASRGLRPKDKEKLKRRYAWEEKEPLAAGLWDHNLFLPCIVYKEVETQQRVFPIEPFVTKCLDDVGRGDLKRKFVEDCKKLSIQPPKKSKSETNSLPIENQGDLGPKVDTILQKVTHIEKMLAVPDNGMIMSNPFSLNSTKMFLTPGLQHTYRQKRDSESATVEM